MRAAVGAMLPRAEGTIVNVTSVNAFFQPDGAVIDYGAAKAALLNVAKALSQELAPRGIRIASVSPGQVETDLWLGDDGVAATIGRATGVDADSVRDQAIGGIPTGRFTTPREVATLVTVLASPRTANVTGRTSSSTAASSRRPEGEPFDLVVEGQEPLAGELEAVLGLQLAVGDVDVDLLLEGRAA